MSRSLAQGHKMEATCKRYPSHSQVIGNAGVNITCDFISDNPVAREHPVLQRQPLSNCLLSLMKIQMNPIHSATIHATSKHFGAETLSPSRWPCRPCDDWMKPHSEGPKHDTTIASPQHGDTSDPSARVLKPSQRWKGFFRGKSPGKRILKTSQKRSTGFYWIPMGLSQHLPSHPLRVSDGAGKRLVMSQSQGLTRLTPKPSLASVLPWPGQMPSPSGWAMILRHDRLMHSSFCASVLGQEFFDVDNTLGRLSSAELISPNLLPLWFRLAFDHLSLHLAALPQSTNGRNSPKLNVAEAYCSRES